MKPWDCNNSPILARANETKQLYVGGAAVLPGAANEIFIIPRQEHVSDSTF